MTLYWEKKCHAVTKFDDKLACLLDDMTQTLAQSGGVGLAAPQIGICRRVVVLLDGDENVIELVNPEIVSSSGEQTRSGKAACPCLVIGGK